MQMIYQSTQKDNEISLLKTDKAIQQAQIDKQRTITFATIIGLGLLILVGVVLAKSYYTKRKANLKLTLAYNNIESKNKLITESIQYAKRLQNAILPPIEILNKNLNNFFIYYSPRDIVSGDFYWFSKHKGNIFFVVADCTGHGVPGALMSMIGNTLLHEIINQKNILDPGQILSLLNEGIINALRQQSNNILAQDDGMDISIVCFEEKNPYKLKYATANHSIFLKEGGIVRVLEGDIYSIGGSLGSTSNNFTTHEITVQPGNIIIMATDGYSDQFGGEKNRKYLVHKF
jgi:serine phosphatase RsbU (regulator of sigma subunit)